MSGGLVYRRIRQLSRLGGLIGGTTPLCELLAGDPAALRFLDLVDISLDPLDEGRRMRTLTNRADMHGVEMFRS